MSILENIHSPADIKKMNEKQLNELCEDIREQLIETVSQNGGHLASNLGVVELSVAMHKVFNSPQDQFIFDVGHQCYTHKLLTGRYDLFPTLRTEGGISGFTRPIESEHDIFSSGHSSTSVSTANGLAKAKTLKGEKGKVVAVLGDGALTGGMIYEAFNTAARHNNNLIVILNDNNMSISKSVGSVAKQLAVVRTTPTYFSFRNATDKFLTKIPLVGIHIVKFINSFKGLIKRKLFHSTFFEDFGFKYYGPIDGHDIGVLIDAMNIARVDNHSVLIHVNTVKGKGYEFAEKNPTQFHGIGKFNIETGEPNVQGSTYSSVFGDTITEFAEKDSRICAVTAAMEEGTGLSEFSKKHKNRFFDVGIAEEHAVTFCAGMAKNGLLPVFAVYSTFLQRCYDQIVHDCAMQSLKIILGIDRAGFVGEDGESHQGVFDISFLNSVPDATIYSPSSFEELRSDIYLAFYKEKNLVAIRYPRGDQRPLPEDYKYENQDYQIYGDEDAEIAFVTYGRLFSNACIAHAQLKEKGVRTKIVKLNKIKPIDNLAVIEACNCKKVYFYEEALKSGGIGEHFTALLLENDFTGKYKHIAVIDEFVKQASVAKQLEIYKLDENSMVDEVLSGEENQS